MFEDNVRSRASVIVHTQAANPLVTLDDSPYISHKYTCTCRQEKPSVGTGAVVAVIVVAVVVVFLIGLWW